MGLDRCLALLPRWWLLKRQVILWTQLVTDGCASAVSVDLGLQTNFSEQAHLQMQNSQILQSQCIS